MAPGRIGFARFGLPAARGWHRFDSFAVRLGLVLTLALLPVGLMAMIQSGKVVAEVRARSEAALAGQTLRAVRPHLALIQQARGAVAVLAGLDPSLCDRVLPQVMTLSGGVLFAGLYDPDGRAYLDGSTITETDIRAFVTLARFDAAYHGLFKCNLRQLADYPQLSAYVARVYRLPGIADTVSIDHIKRGYYSIKSLNPNGIVPAGPDLSALSLGA